ncbi:1-acyl-sn-glycerol-3-phosphate acyltransferase [Candidatus Uhrbacteria bacterium]|nr:1-acyl-sn-glycerol-3-phosphate acyltransferase [Candidatus Uhrbacteria bacterium]
MSIFLLFMVALTYPDIVLRRALNAVTRASLSQRRKTEVAWQLVWARHYWRLVARLLNMGFSLRAPELSWRGHYIVILNHRNVLDHLVAAKVFHEMGVEDPRWIVKEQMRKAPIVGTSLERAQFAFVSRTRNPQDIDRIRQMARIACVDHVSVALYPEGTRFNGKPKAGTRYSAVGEPKVGGFATLCEELPDYRVLVVCIDWGDLPDARTIWDGSAYLGREVRVSVWEQINPGRDGAQDFLTRVWNEMERRLTESLGRVLAMRVRTADVEGHGRV